MSTTSRSFLIRDGLDSDIDACLSLDNHYQTDYVWQMHVRQENDGWQIMFNTERLPRTLEVEYAADEKRLRFALAAEQCFLVAVDRDEADVLGYLTMRNDPVYQIALIQDVVVSRAYRRHHIGSRLLNVARRWAGEHDLKRLTIETQTKNYPGILFCQNAGFAFCGFNDRYLPNQDIAVFFSQSVR
jgi:GNAT superfamily N-acetyltransferase